MDEHEDDLDAPTVAPGTDNVTALAEAIAAGLELIAHAIESGLREVAEAVRRGR